MLFVSLPLKLTLCNYILTCLGKKNCFLEVFWKKKLRNLQIHDPDLAGLHSVQS